LPERRAVVLLSGGLDSATALAIAREQGYVCHALSVDYGQRHHAELAAAQRVAAQLGARAHRVAHVDINQFGGSALTDTGIAVPTGGVQPASRSPTCRRATPSCCRWALAWAEVLGARATCSWA